MLHRSLSTRNLNLGILSVLHRVEEGATRLRSWFCLFVLLPRLRLDGIVDSKVALLVMRTVLRTPGDFILIPLLSSVASNSQTLGYPPKG